MKITIDFSRDFLHVLFSIVELAFAVLSTYALGHYYIERQKREVEKAERMMQEQQNDQDEE